MGEADLAAAQRICLAYYDGTNWVHAVDGNSTPGGTWDTGAYDPASDFVLGKYGVDTANDVVWAVVDHTGQFAERIVNENDIAAGNAHGLRRGSRLS